MSWPEEPQGRGIEGQVGNQNNSPAGRAPDYDRDEPPAAEREIVSRSSSFDGARGDGMGETETPPLPPSTSVVVTVTDPRGLHLRSGRDVVRLASQFQAQITASNLSRNSGAVNLKSILQLMQLQARQGHDLQLAASGPDAAAAIDALCSIF